MRETKKTHDFSNWKTVSRDTRSWGRVRDEIAALVAGPAEDWNYVVCRLEYSSERMELGDVRLQAKINIYIESRQTETSMSMVGNPVCMLLRECRKLRSSPWLLLSSKRWTFLPFLLPNLRKTRAQKNISALSLSLTSFLTLLMRGQSPSRLSCSSSLAISVIDVW